MFEANEACLVVIDVQGKLASLMHDRDRVVRNILALIEGAKLLRIPILWTEQVPQKIGATIPELADVLQPLKPIAKETFSCWFCPEFQKELKEINRSYVIIVGIEAHVCVYQTVAHLLENGYEPYIAVDCISARAGENRQLGIAAMEQLGAYITGVEMILCQMLETTAHPKFRDILKLIK